MSEPIRRYATGALGLVPPFALALPCAAGRRETVADHAARLYEAALAGTLALSDHRGVALLLSDTSAAISAADCRAAQRLATDLLQRRARSAVGLTRSIAAALAMAEDVAEGATDADLHAVLAQISDLLDGALSLTAD